MKILRRVVFILILLVMIFSSFLIKSGYDIYIQALKNMPLDKKVERIKEIDNYTKIDEVPQIYINAVISVEDHRFYTHNGIDLIAVVMAAPNSKTRFSEAINLLNYGFSNCYIYTDENPIELQHVEISGGVKNTVGCEYQKTFSYLFMNKIDNDKIMREVVYDTGLVAPIDKGTQVGYVTYSIEGQTLGEIPIVATEDMGKATFWDMIKKVAFFMVGGEEIAGT